jgi:hypothetical protein
MVVDDHELVRSGISSMLSATDDLHVVAEAETAADAVRTAERERRDLHRDLHGAEVEADRKVFFEPHAHFFDTYAAPPLRQLERRYANNSGMLSVWTVEPANGGRAYFTIVADAELPPAIGWLMRPVLARMFYRLNFPTFIRAVEHEELTGFAGQSVTAQPG